MNKSEDERIAIDEVDLILAELQNYMINVPATMKAKEAIESLLREAKISELERISKANTGNGIQFYFEDMKDKNNGWRSMKEYVPERIAQLTQEQSND